MRVKSHREPRVWPAGTDLAVQVYTLTNEFPREEIYGLTRQMRRAAVSVPSTIAEDHAREHTWEYLKFLSIAQGSLSKPATQLAIAARVGYCAEEKTVPIFTEIIRLRRPLFAHRNSLKRL